MWPSHVWSLFTRPVINQSNRGSIVLKALILLRGTSLRQLPFSVLLSCLLLSFTLLNETVTDWRRKRPQIRVLLTSQPDRWTPLRISWRTHPLSPEKRHQSRPSTPRPLSPEESSPLRCSSPRSGSGTGSRGGRRDNRGQVLVMDLVSDAVHVNSARYSNRRCLV